MNYKDDEANREFLVIEIGTHQGVHIDKLFGPLSAEQVRIYIDYKTDEWVVERRHCMAVGDKWEEKARWHCQESVCSPYDEDESGDG